MLLAELAIDEKESRAGLCHFHIEAIRVLVFIFGQALILKEHRLFVNHISQFTGQPEEIEDSVPYRTCTATGCITIRMVSRNGFACISHARLLSATCSHGGFSRDDALEVTLLKLCS